MKYETAHFAMQIKDSGFGGMTQHFDTDTAEERGQSCEARRLLKSSSAPAGRQAAGAAMSLGDLHQRLHVHPGQRLKDVPQCGQV